MKKATFTNGNQCATYTVTLADDGTIIWSDGLWHSISAGNGTPHITVAGVTYTAQPGDKTTAFIIMEDNQNAKPQTASKTANGEKTERKPRAKKADINIYKISTASENRVADLLYTAVTSTAQTLTEAGATDAQIASGLTVLVNMLNGTTDPASIRESVTAELESLKQAEESERAEKEILATMRKMECDRALAIIIINAKRNYYTANESKTEE